jgi:rubredoxin
MLRTRPGKMMCDKHAGTPKIKVGDEWQCPKCNVEAKTAPVVVYDCPTHGKDVPVFILSQEGQIRLGPVCTQCMDVMLKATLPSLVVREEMRVIQSAEVAEDSGKQ